VICPQCEEEFGWDVMVCPHCDVETVDRLPGPAPAPDVQLVTVFAAADAGVIALAKSLLEAEGIDFFVRGEGLQDLFGLGRLMGFNPVPGAAQFCVRADDEPRARALLENLDGPDAAADDD
jgi:hypothetical protein